MIWCPDTTYATGGFRVTIDRIRHRGTSATMAVIFLAFLGIVGFADASGHQSGSGALVVDSSLDLQLIAGMVAEKDAEAL